MARPNPNLFSEWMFLLVRGFSRAARLPIGQRIRMATSRLLARSHPTVVSVGQIITTPMKTILSFITDPSGNSIELIEFQPGAPAKEAMDRWR